jgi:hypothetical protein
MVSKLLLVSAVFLGTLTGSADGFLFEGSCPFWICINLCRAGYVIGSNGCPGCICKPEEPKPLCPFLICGKKCINGYNEDAEGCYVCDCAPSDTPGVCPAVNCNPPCTSGYEVDNLGCKTCTCKPTTGPVLHESLKPIAWMLGKWKTTTGLAQFPTMKDFVYMEMINFFHVGQSNIQFTFEAFNPITYAPMHREAGFIKVKPGTNVVAMATAHNRGVVDVEEGEYSENQITLQSTKIADISFVIPPAVTELRRTYKLVGDRMEKIVDMGTARTNTQLHLTGQFDRV